MSASRLAVVIPTYRRPALLARLLNDLAGQSRRPDELWIVDGEGGCAATRRVAAASAWARTGGLTAILESTRANLPFQRYVGRLAADSCDGLIYFDDDMRLRSPDVVAGLAGALEQGAAAATAEIEMGPQAARRAGLGRWLGPASRSRPGALTAGGTRVAPADGAEPYVRVEWLRGGAMAFRKEALPKDQFSTELFDLAELGYGLGEDSVLAAIAARSGELWLARDVDVEHSGDDATRAYAAADPRRRGYARGVSRRLLASLRKVSATALWAAHLGAMAEAVLALRADAPDYVAGYLRGATAHARTGRYCPGGSVNWTGEARATLRACAIVDRRAA